jgi:uncharacterized membrane protein
MTAATAAMAGAGLMYLLDPGLGRRRRALIADKVLHASKVAARALDTTARDLSNRTQGVVAETTRLFKNDEVSEDVLIERVRSAIGRVVSHPSSIEISAEGSRIILSGPILDEEHDRLLKRVRKVRGIRFVDDRLRPHRERGGEPGLQGGTGRMERTEMMQTNWAPAPRAAAIVTGLGAVLLGAGRRDLPGTLLAGAGAVLFARGATNLELSRLLGIGSGRRSIDLQKTITINAPLERVYSAWRDYENFPFFMSRVREVHDLGDGRSHWIVNGPANTKVEWDAVITQNVPNQVIAWKTEPGALVGHAGVVRFDGEGDATRVQVRFSYNPPAGALGHSLAWLIGADPKSAFDEDLVRMKSFIETGIRPHDATGRYLG